MPLIHFKSYSCVFSSIIQVRVLSTLHLVIPISSDRHGPEGDARLLRGSDQQVDNTVIWNTNVTSSLGGAGLQDSRALSAESKH